MTISLYDAGKRFNRDWIFRHFNYTFTSGNSYAVIGPNGSGKSTLLQVISGAVGLNEGQLAVNRNSSAGTIPSGDNGENVYQHISIAAPYLEVIEEMTVTEFLQFHQKFKALLPALDIQQIIDVVGLANATDKQIRYYSSGMKQRVKLAQAIFSDVPVILLDEPCTNLDSTGIALYQQLIKTYCASRLVIVSSNDEAEYGFCNQKINMLAFK
jgi:ABC-type multidrug transport system ATPase subunit